MTSTRRRRHRPARATTADAEATTAEGEHAGATTAEGEHARGGEHETVPPVVRTVTWFSIGGIDFEFGTLLDGLAAMMLITVCIISLLVHIYSTAYLDGDVRFTHYYAFLSLFTASMLFYVLSSNTLQMLVGWELVGVCSFVLIGHWWEEKKNTDAALKAFLTNRVGDMGLIIGVTITFFAAGANSFNVIHINEYALSGGANTTLLLVGALCLFGGVTSKSGQFPLHTWLPDAMAGPTPVSALIHAATMVVAGVYLIARLYAVFFEGLGIGSSSLHYVAFIGGFTTIIGGALAFAQTDIKKVLAYSTISQLGYMVMALGVGAWTAGVFHLFTHAFFKACLFLGAGSVSHACHHTFDMREMGGLRKHMKVTHATFLIATLALAGIVPARRLLVEGRDPRRSGQQGQQHAYTLMLVFGLITALMTAAYMGRAYWMTFWGDYRGHGTPHESPKVITVPLVILAVVRRRPRLPELPDQRLRRSSCRAAHDPVRALRRADLRLPGGEHAEFTPWLAVLSTILAVTGVVHRLRLLRAQQGTPRPHPSQQGRQGGVHVPREQVLPRHPLHRHHRRRHEGSPRPGGLLVQPERARRHHRRHRSGVEEGVRRSCTGTSTSSSSTESSTAPVWSRTNPASSSVVCRPARFSSTPPSSSPVWSFSPVCSCSSSRSPGPTR